MPKDEARVAEIKETFVARDHHIRESWVKAMELRLVRDELEKCQKNEGVNHYENCGWLADKYIQMLQNNRVKGYKVIDI